MITELIWDSNFFKKKIGEFNLLNKDFDNIFTALKKAKEDDFSYLICKIHSFDVEVIKSLMSAGFYLSDIDITFYILTSEFIFKDDKELSDLKRRIIVAEDKHILDLKEMVVSLFTDSRFYNDPFFKKDEADQLFQTWIHNSLKGEMADIVFYLDRKGFVTLKRTSDKGEVILIGVKSEFRGKKIGSALIEKSMEWFIKEGVSYVRVRTQLRNINAINFYIKLNFKVESYDLIFSKIL